MDNIRYETNLLSKIQWTAGFIDADGGFYINNSRSIYIHASQHDRRIFLLKKLQIFWGGKIKPNYSEPNNNFWILPSPNAADLMMTLYVLMSPDRQKQIRKCLKIWKSAQPHNKHKTHCKRGHLLKGSNLYVNSRGGRICRICHNAAHRKYYHKYKTTMCQDINKTTTSGNLKGGDVDEKFIV